MWDMDERKRWSFVSNLRGTEYEIWLYQPLDVLLSIKGVYDKKIAQSSAAAIKDMLCALLQTMDIMRGPCYDPVLVYSDALEAVISISVIMRYKAAMMQYKEDASMVLSHADNKAKEIILTAIREDAKTSYFDLLAQKGTEQENLSYVLERMIQERTLSAVIAETERSKKFDGWHIKES